MLQLTTPARNLISRLTRRQPAVAYRTFYTRGDDLLSPVDYRRSFESDLSRAMSGSSNVSDETAARAYAISATANACTEKRASLTASIPLKVTDENGDDIEDTELAYFAANTATTFALSVRSALIWGRVYLRKRYNKEGYPTGLEWINPQRVREIADRDGGIESYDIQRVTIWGTGAAERVPAKDVIYFQMFDTDPAGAGMSKYEAAWRSIGVEGGIATHAAAFFLNSAAPDGMLSFDQPLSDPQFEKAKSDWRVFKGAKNAHRTAVMPPGARWTAISAPPKDLAMGELDDKQTKKIHAVFEVDPTLTGMEATSDPLGASSTFEQVVIAHLRDVAIPFLTMHLLPALNDQWAAIDFSEPYTLAVDTANIAAFADANLLKSETAINLTAGGVLDYNEGRALLGQPERTDYITRDPTQVSKLWSDGVITLFQYISLVGAPSSPLPMDMMNVNGIGLVPVVEMPTLWSKRILISPSVYNSEIITGEPLPQPVDPNTVIPTLGNEQPAEVAQEVGILPGNSPATPALPATVEPVRSAQPLELALSFAGNAFVRYCRRALSEALTAQGIDAQWVSEDAWRLTLARTDQWTPAAASNIIKASNYADTRPLDFTTAGFERSSVAIFLSIEGDASGMYRSADLDLESASVTPKSFYLPGILLCTLSAEAVIKLPTAESYPLVGNTVTLLRGDEPLHTWTLTGVSAARSKELQNWRSVAAKGKDFAPDVLRDSDVAAFVADALAADVEVDDVFDMARDMLRGLLTWRAYPETREMFVSEITTILFAGQSSELDRRNFSARMRTLIRRAGLQAFRDGFEAGGVSPESFDEDQLKAFRQWQDETSGYITNLGTEMFKGEGLTEAQIEPRASLWANKSLQSIYYTGLNFAAADKPFTWKLGGTLDHCSDCLANNGQTKTMKQWMEAGLPQAHSLECGGWNCLCSILPAE